MKLISQHTVISILVTDQDEALRFYREKLGLEIRNDVTFGPGLRLLTVAPKGQVKPEIVLAKPDLTFYEEERLKKLKGQSAQRFTRVFATENCTKEYELLQMRGVNFICTPSKQIYGIEAIFVDPFDNAFTLLEASPEAHSLFANYHFGSAA